MWTDVISKVLKDLNADDDINWATAADRDDLNDLNQYVDRFKHLILVYVQMIEELQTHLNINDVETDKLQSVVEQMKTTLKNWKRVCKGLKDIHNQVKLAMKWEKLWGMVYENVENEMNKLS